MDIISYTRQFIYWPHSQPNPLIYSYTDVGLKCYRLSRHFVLINDIILSISDEVIHYSPLSEECAARISKLSSLGVWFIVAEGEQESPIFKEQRAEYVKVYTPTYRPHPYAFNKVFYYQLLETNGIVVSQYELQGEDHFTVIEKLMECDYQLTKVC